MEQWKLGMAFIRTIESKLEFCNRTMEIIDITNANGK